MKRIFTVLAMVCSFVPWTNAQRVCGTMDHQLMIEQQDPSVIQRRQEIESFTNEFVTHYSNDGERALVTIPVVVHVVWNTATENISDAQIQSQLTVLNADFRKLNSDVSGVPSAFSGLAADANIEFCLATVAPNGSATTGIERTQTSQTSFGTNDQVKSTTTGGANAWNATKYLNLWVCDISGGILGYAQFPGGSNSTDGVVIDYQYFGTIGTATAPYNKGRTATHEVGHWLNLYHIWGDDSGACTGSDLVSDTPNQADENYGCPTFPAVSCTNGPNGDMFMNYMDYTDDACMFMFSTGQATRMQALFAAGGARVSLLSSTACGTATPTCGIPSGLTTGGLTASAATASWTAVSGALSYNFRYKLSSASTWTTSNVTGTSVSLSALAACTGYDWQVQTVCSSGSSAFSSSATFTTTGCAATYCTSSGNTADEFINKVVLNTINNTSGNNGGYGNFTAQSTTLNKGQAYTITLTPGFTSSAYTEVFRIWVDLNGDLDFADTGEQVYAPSGSTGAVSGSITIPTTAITGTTRMRVSMSYNTASSYCGTLTYGEVEDYTINLAVGTTTCGVPASLTASSITATSAVLGWGSVSGATSYSLQWKPASASSWSTVSVSATSYTLSGLAASTSYNFQVAAICASGTSAYSTASTFATSAASTCSDVYETNNTSATATTMPVNTNITAIISSASDKDYFKFTTTSAARNIRIDLTNLPADYDVRLYNPSGTQVGISQNGGTTSEVITYNNGAIGTYRVYVYGYNGVFSASSCYTLKAGVSSTSFREGDVEEYSTGSLPTEAIALTNAYPNPTNGKLNLKFFVQGESMVYISMVDVTGREVMKSSYSAAEGVNFTTLDLAELSNGYYTLILSDGSNMTNTRIVKN